MTGTTGARDRRAALDARRARRAAVTDPAGRAWRRPPSSSACARARWRRRGAACSTSGTARRSPRRCSTRLGRMGYLDDLAFARAWMESRDRSRPRGRDCAAPGAAAARAWTRPSSGGPSRTARRRGEAVLAAADAVRHPTMRAATRTPVRGRSDRRAARRLLARRSASLMRREPDPRKRRQKAYAAAGAQWVRSGHLPRGEPGGHRVGSR